MKTSKTLIAATLLTLCSSAVLAKPIDKATKQKVIDSTLTALDQSYVYPKVAAKMRAEVERRQANGEYASINDHIEFADKLTEDLRSVSHDKHLRVRPSDAPRKPRPRSISQVDPRHNFGFETAKLRADGIGYIKLNMFANGPEALNEAAKALSTVKDAKALIFDLRDNIGGSPRMIEFISSYLFDKPTRLNVFYDSKGNEVGQSLTYLDIPGKRFAKQLPVYVVTSGFTFSAAEEFSYNLQSFGRGTIVGETTGGGAHPIMPSNIDDDFTVIVPFRRAWNPITKTNWEGVGVIPDIKSVREQALDVAIAEALKVIKTTT